MTKQEKKPTTADQLAEIVATEFGGVQARFYEALGITRQAHHDAKKQKGDNLGKKYVQLIRMYELGRARGRKDAEIAAKGSAKGDKSNA